jgi:hypothetical protein
VIWPGASVICLSDNDRWQHLTVPGMTPDNTLVEAVAPAIAHTVQAARVLGLADALDTRMAKQGLKGFPTLVVVGRLRSGDLATYSSTFNLVAVSPGLEAERMIDVMVHETLGHFITVPCGPLRLEICPFNVRTWVWNLLSEADAHAKEWAYIAYRHGTAKGSHGSRNILREYNSQYKSYANVPYAQHAFDLLEEKPELLVHMQNNGVVPKEFLVELLSIFWRFPPERYLLRYADALAYGPSDDISQSLSAISYLDPTDRKKLEAAFRDSALHRALSKHPMPKHADVKQLIDGSLGVKIREP